MSKLKRPEDMNFGADWKWSCIIARLVFGADGVPVLRLNVQSYLDSGNIAALIKKLHEYRRYQRQAEMRRVKELVKMKNRTHSLNRDLRLLRASIRWSR